MRTWAVTAALLGVVITVVVYSSLLLPLDLGLGLVGGYLELGDSTIHFAISIAWLVLVLSLGWILTRTLSDKVRTWKVIWTVGLGVAISTVTSLPIVVLMYNELDYAMPTGQVVVSGGLGVVYWLLLVIGGVLLFVAPIALAVVARSGPGENQLVEGEAGDRAD